MEDGIITDTQTLQYHVAINSSTLVQNIHLRELVDGRVVYQGDTNEDGCTEEKHSYYSYISMLVISLIVRSLKCPESYGSHGSFKVSWVSWVS